MGHSYSWIAVSGIWSSPSNWDDLTIMQDPALTAPGTADTVAFGGAAFPALDLVGGPGGASNMGLGGGLALVGTLQVATLASIGTYDTLDVLRGGTLAAGSVSLGNQYLGSVLQVTGAGSQLLVAGTLNSGGVITVSNHGLLRAASLTVAENPGTIGLTVDPTATVEVGLAGGAAAGVITVDAGATFNPGGLILAPVVDNGTLAGNATFAGAVSGTGVITGGTFQAAVGSGLTVALLQNYGTVYVPASGFAATIANFNTSEAIDIPAAIAAATFIQTSAAGGTLTLTAPGGATVESIDLSGNFAGRGFLVLPVLGSTDSEITLAANTPAPVTPASGGSGGGQTFLWSGAAGDRSWNTPGNWYTFSNGVSATATVAPGTLDQAGSSYGGTSFGPGTIVAGNGNAASFLLSGTADLTGVFAFGTVSMGQSSFQGGLPGYLNLVPQGTVTAGGIGGFGQVSVGMAASLSVTGAVSLGGYSPTIFRTSVVGSALAVTGGGDARVDAVTLTTGTHLSVDAVSILEVGTAGGAAAGVLTVDADAPVYGNGSLLAPAVVDNGSIIASGGTLVVGAGVTGSGVLEVTATADLVLLGSVAATEQVLFAGAGATLDATAVGGMAGLIGGFVTGDTILLPGSVVSGSYSGGTLSLFGAGGSAAGSLRFAGTLAGTPLLQPTAGGATAVILSNGSLATGAGAASAGTTNHIYQWTAAAGGAWNVAANWYDDYTSSPAAVAPGPGDLADIGNPGAPFGPVFGAGNAGILLFAISSVLADGNFTANSFMVEGSSSPSGVIAEIGPGASLVAASGTIEGRLVVDGAGAAVTVSGLTQLGGYSASLGVGGGGTVQLAALTASIGTIGVDAGSVLEVGLAGGAAAGFLTVDAGRTLSSGAAVAIDAPVIDNGTFSGGGTIDGSVSGSGLLQLVPGLPLLVNGTIGAGQRIDFGAGVAAIGFDAGSAPGAISSFAPTDVIDLFGPAVDAASYTATGPGIGTLALTADGAVVQTLTLTGNFAGETFLANPDRTSGTDIVVVPSAGVACFAAGSRIATPRGPVAVEALVVGEPVALARGGSGRVVWIGHRRIDLRRHRRPWDVQPVRVRRGAFGPGLPLADLRLSPDHAVFVDGVLVPVRGLINGRTIVQEAVREVMYFHVELEAHDVLLAEGLPCESYLDTGNRAAFANGGAAVMLDADFARGVWSARGCAPLLLDGRRLTAIRQRLLDRAQAAGHVLTEDAALRVRADGRRLPLRVEQGRCHVALPPGTRRLRLVSRRWTPAHSRAGEPDCRTLGVAISDIRLDRRPVAPDDSRLSSGWHEPEPGCRYRWTDGDAGMALAGVRDVSFVVAATGSYWAPEVLPGSAGSGRQRSTRRR